METETKVWIGQRIKELRDSAKLSQTQLAEQLQIDTRQIGRLERGQSAPKLETLDDIAHFFGIDLAGFFAPLSQSGAEPVFQGAHLLTPADRKVLQTIIHHLISGRGA